MAESHILGDFDAEPVQQTLWTPDVERGAQLLAPGIADQIYEQSFASIPGISRDQADELVYAFDAFLAEVPSPDPEVIVTFYNQEDEEVYFDPADDPSSEWHQYRSRYFVPGYGKPFGLTDRTLEGTVTAEHDLSKELSIDPKKYFQFVPEMRARIEGHAEAYNWGAIPPSLLRLLDLAKPVHEYAQQATVEVLSRIERETDRPGLMRRLAPDARILGMSPLRILGYDPVTPENAGKHSAQPHFDKGVTTIAISESRLGLRVEDPRGKMQLVERAEDEAAFFVSSGFARLGGFIAEQPGTIDNNGMLRREDGTVVHLGIRTGKPIDFLRDPIARRTLHEVIDMPGDDFSERIGRYALIYFLDCHDGHFTGKRDNH